MHLTRALRGRRLGILGLGRIGKDIARKAEAFDVEIAYHGRSRQDVPYRFYGHLVEIARDSDFLIAIFHVVAAIDKIVNRVVIDAMGPAGRVINVAHSLAGADTAAMYAPQDGHVVGAALAIRLCETRVR